MPSQFERQHDDLGAVLGEGFALLRIKCFIGSAASLQFANPHPESARQSIVPVATAHLGRFIASPLA
jgi:hypothetical protein